MKQFADRHHSERSFNVGDLVYLLRRVINQRLSPKYYSPFPVLKKVRAVAYTLQLPPGSRIHPTFHVPQLKKHIGSSPAQAHLPLHDDHGAMQKEPVKIVDRRIVKKGNQAVKEVQRLITAARDHALTLQQESDLSLSIELFCYVVLLESWFNHKSDTDVMLDFDKPMVKFVKAMILC
ncbi:BSD domain-containing protein 1-A-like [Gossypium australe]|uniref:BSD domain-containing protein 1-A-like n=1 Tax=Gossypium australe TaxID=47621 RepID=A0A5B6W6L1_9ROSI|nr:BSD domain-containing protein 1-A-like [Gossypium australe]